MESALLRLRDSCAVVDRRTVDWDEALRQLALPLTRIFALRGVLPDNGTSAGRRSGLPTS